MMKNNSSIDTVQLFVFRKNSKVKVKKTETMKQNSKKTMNNVFG